MRILSDDAASRIRTEASRFPESRSALLPALHIAQDEVGRVGPEVMEDVAALLSLPYSDVEEVVSFYTMYYQDRVGTYVLEVCKTVPCAILGADEIIEHIADRLNIEPGETTPDGMFTLLRVECLAGCHRAPVMQVNSRYYENLTPEKTDRLIDLMRENARFRQGKSREAPLPQVPGLEQGV
ncbi:MAG TPA: NAD(P)H-dependent oxidoreductase subunit E [Chloroflexota bacterium]|nr:NAD(P)H-dependent oxidoreductase subunit E [Chloroflexota bacterium]